MLNDMKFNTDTNFYFHYIKKNIIFNDFINILLINNGKII